MTTISSNFPWQVAASYVSDAFEQSIYGFTIYNPSLINPLQIGNGLSVSANSPDETKTISEYCMSIKDNTVLANNSVVDYDNGNHWLYLPPGHSDQSSASVTTGFYGQVNKKMSFRSFFRVSVNPSANVGSSPRFFGFTGRVLSGMTNIKGALTGTTTNTTAAGYRAGFYVNNNGAYSLYLDGQTISIPNDAWTSDGTTGRKDNWYKLRLDITPYFEGLDISTSSYGGDIVELFILRNNGTWAPVATDPPEPVLTKNASWTSAYGIGNNLGFNTFTSVHSPRGFGFATIGMQEGITYYISDFALLTADITSQQ